MDLEKKDAQRNWRSLDPRKGRSGTAKRARRALKRSSRVRVTQMLARDEKGLTIG